MLVSYLAGGGGKVGRMWNFLVKGAGVCLYDWVLHQVLEGSQKYNRTPYRRATRRSTFHQTCRTVSQLATD